MRSGRSRPPAVGLRFPAHLSPLLKSVSVLHESEARDPLPVSDSCRTGVGSRPGASKTKRLLFVKRYAAPLQRRSVPKAARPQPNILPSAFTSASARSKAINAEDLVEAFETGELSGENFRMASTSAHVMYPEDRLTDRRMGPCGSSIRCELGPDSRQSVRHGYRDEPLSRGV